MTRALVASAGLDRIAAASGVRLDPPIVLPSRTILELSGEAVRARLCAFTDDAGREFCLRPDMTTPIADMVARGAAEARRYYYSGPVFRLPATPNDAIEFDQIGFEWFGGSSPAEDAEAVALTFEAASLSGAGDVSARVGDVGLYHAVVDALGFTPAWRVRLKRSFARRRGPLELLEAATAPAAGGKSALAASLARMPHDEAVLAVEDIFSIAGVQPVGGRGAAEIAERLRESVQEGAPEAADVARLKAFLALEAPVAVAVRTLSAFAAEAGLSIAPAIDAFGQKLSLTEALGPAYWQGAVYSGQVGRRFEYYDGLVFDLVRPGQPERPVAAGGRYDGLLSRMGAGTRIAAIGAALRVDRMGEGAR